MASCCVLRRWCLHQSLWVRDMRMTLPLATQVLLQFDVNDGVRTPAPCRQHTVTMQAGVVGHSAC